MNLYHTFKYILIFLPGFAACQPQPGKVGSDEYAIINVVLKNAVIPKASYRDRILAAYNIPLFPPVKLTPKELADAKAEQKRKQDSVIKVFSTAKLYIGLKDSLIRFPQNELQPVGDLASGGRFKPKLNNPQQVKEIAALVSDELPAAPLEKKLIQSPYKYDLILFNGKTELSKFPAHTFSLFVVSRVSFNQVKTMACVYEEDDCGLMCGTGSVYFLIKKDNTWIIIDRCTLWIQ